jgi:subtilisin family serine protease
VRVLVRLHLPGAGFTAESHLPPASVVRQRQDVRQAQSEVAARLRGKRHAVLRQYQTLPLLALEVGPEALAELEAAFSVDVIAEDRLRRSQLADSVPQIEGDLVWGNGFDGTGTVVAVLDTGVERTHPFLAGKVVEEACYSSTIAGQSQSVCPNGQESQTGTGSAAPCDLEGCYHGTHVAGVIAGNGAGAGVPFSGVARGAELMAVQVFSRITSPSLCGGFFFVPCLGAWESDIIAGLERVYQIRATRNFVAANLSLGGDLFTAPCAADIHKPIIDNLRAAGIATIAASGNDGSLDSIAAPACVPTAISVGSVGSTDEVSWFSNVAPFLTLFAPGESVTSALEGGGFMAADGTSAATPHVAGAWAVLKQAAPAATVDEVQEALVSTGLPVTELLTGITKPRIRVFQALAALVDSPLIGAITPPRGGQGQTLDVTIAGVNFQDGAAVSFGSGVDVTEVTFSSATEIVATVSIAMSATPGLRTVVVTNPDASTGTRVDGFRVTLPPPQVALTWNGKERDRVRQSETQLTADGQLDGTLTATVTGPGGPRTVTGLVLTASSGGQWDTIPDNLKWALGAANTLDSALRNAADGSVHFAVVNETFSVFATDDLNALFPPGLQLTLTVTFDDETVVAASTMVPFPPPPPPAPAMTLAWNGKVRDRVRQSETQVAADGQLDGTLTMTLDGSGGPHTVKRLVLTTSGGGQWDTIPGNGKWALGAADTLDSALRNAGDGSVSFTVANGAFSVFATDDANALFPVGLQLTLTVTFDNDAVGSASVTIPAPPPPPAMTLAWDGKVRDRARQAEGAAVGDGQLDGTLTATLSGPGGPWTLKRLVLTIPGGGQWDTIPGNGKWTLGAADTLDAAVRNAADGSVSFAVVNGAFSVFATDYTPPLFPVGQQLTLTATFEGDAVAVASVTILAPPPGVTTVSPASGAQGATVPVTVTGTSFVTGATLNVGEGVTVSNVAVPSATQLTATLAIAATAAIGRRRPPRRRRR